MPIYEYQCVTCGTVSDIKHGFKELVSEPCPKCGGVELKRLFNPASIVFKGSGFYITDSRKSGESAKTESTPESKPEKKADTPASTGPPKSDAAA